ncbi:unnamed protein product, partial [marine sediment metagenome]
EEIDPYFYPEFDLKNRTYIDELRNTDIIHQSNDKVGDELAYISYDSSKRRILIEDKDSNPAIKMSLTSGYLVSGLIASSDCKVAEFYLEDFKDDKTNLIDLIEFYDVKNDYKQVNRSFWFKYGIEKTECFGEGAEEECFNYTTWAEFNTLDEIPHKNITIGLFTKTNILERIEWIPTIEGFEILQWAAWNVTTASYLQLFNVSSEDLFPMGVFFKHDGTKMYVIGSFNGNVYEYDLSTAWNVTTASYLQLFDVSSEGAFSLGVFFKPDGTKMYVTGFLNVYEYDLSTA